MSFAPFVGRLPAALLAAFMMIVPAGSAIAQGAAPPAGAPEAPPPTVGPSPGPKTPLPPRDTPRAPQPGGGGSAGAGPSTPLPPRDTPRAQQPGQRQAAHPDPDWPCVQVKVGAMSYGQVWAGPPLEEAFGKWRDDAAVAELVPTLTARRTSREDAVAAIERFAKAEGERKKEKLTLLYAGVFEEINAQRSKIVTGIERYSRKQRELSERIKDESLKMAAAQKDMAAQMSPEGVKAQEALNWDTRIYEERAQSLTYVCETPVILEQLAFDLAREIQSRLD